MWYSPHEMLSRNCLFNFLVGNRGGGKTYGTKKWAIKDFIKNKNQFVYLRRYKSELETVSTYFADIQAEFPNHKLTVKGNKFYINDEVCGYAIPLSTWITKKSTSFPFVDKILFDEFLIERKQTIRYLPNEVKNFLDMYETIARMRDNVRVVFIANAISIVNPYFMYFNILPNMNKRFTQFDDILIEIFKDNDYIEKKQKTRFGRLINGTHYGNYAINNSFLQDNNNFIEERSHNSKHQFIISYKNETYGVWFDFKSSKCYVSKKFDKSTRFKFVFTEADLSEENYYIKSWHDNQLIETMVMCFKDSRLMFDCQESKVAIFEVLTKLNIFT